MSTKQATREEVAITQSLYQFWEEVQLEYDLLAVAVKENWVLTLYAGRCCHDLISFVAFCWVEASFDRSMFGHRPLPP